MAFEDFFDVDLGDISQAYMSYRMMEDMPDEVKDRYWEMVLAGETPTLLNVGVEAPVAEPGIMVGGGVITAGIFALALWLVFRKK